MVSEWGSLGPGAAIRGSTTLAWRPPAGSRGARRSPLRRRPSLAPAGRLVMPVGGRDGTQQLLRLTRRGAHETHRETLMGVRFVPLTGAQGWPG